ncbi:MAG: TIGR04282 family arsenosugar biosynthesis glycosyltransferase [Gammaproteobacteria bacterium]|nr:TIGR04282 family arsenosugar biosynthesis glycosyltransferase [Gammaproteobacteria bacterium]
MSAPDLILFAKQPVPGLVKTRLIPSLGVVGAAAAFAEMVRASCAKAVFNWPGQVWLYGWPDEDHPLFQEMGCTLGVRLARQTPGDLGEKMYRALCEGVERSGAAALMGCDVPHCPPDTLHQAAAALQKGTPVIGPAADGGYYLIGFCGPVPEACFRDIPWSTPAVLACTRAAAPATLHELPVLADLDHGSDLASYAAGKLP